MNITPCDSCGHIRGCGKFVIPSITDKEKGLIMRRIYWLCDECALTIAELLEKEINTKGE